MPTPSRPPPDADVFIECEPDPSLLPFEASNVMACPPLGGLFIPAGETWILDTDAATLRENADAPRPLEAAHFAIQDDAPEILVASWDDVQIEEGGTLRVVGDRAAALISTTSIDIDGTLDASAEAASAGPGADHASACADGFGDDGERQTAHLNAAGSGGGGGGYGEAGGDGAPVVDNDGDPVGDPSAGGASHGEDALSPLRGGCRGGEGGRSGGLGGAGGGALQLVAAEDIHIDDTGVVTVSGGGGREAGSDRRGGGGGGSGGALLLEASGVSIEGALTANGGGGGEGRRGFALADPGADGFPASADPAPGGSRNTVGGDGGDGGARDIAAEDGDVGDNGTFSSSPGGGGGGGGVGRIRIGSCEDADIDSDVLSPSAALASLSCS